MFDKGVINKVKACTVAIGLVEKDGHMPVEIVGTGFLVNSKGYAMTAAHVSERCLDLIEAGRARKMSLERAVFFTKRDSAGKLHFYAARIADRVFRSDMVIKPKGYAMPDSIDVAVFNIGAKIPLPYLEIKQPSDIELYEEIALSSYPSGLQTMNW